MSRNEIYIALALVSLLLVSVVWKHELAYRRSLLSDQKPVEIEIPQYQQKIFVPETTAKGYLGKRKPDGYGWTKKYGHNIILQTNLLILLDQYMSIEKGLCQLKIISTGILQVETRV